MSNKVGAERLFAPFLDPVDMVGLFEADQPLSEVRALALGSGLRFPLVCDASATLGEHLSATEFASGSARFGPYSDNVLGMNWRLPDGKLVRVGEQVVKSTTGYDLQRFLLHMGSESGVAESYVLRLRPMGDGLAQGRFTGKAEALDRLCNYFRFSPWAHWLDTVDLIVAESGSSVEVTANCLEGEPPLYEAYFKEAAFTSGCEFEICPVQLPTSLPDYCVKLLSGDRSGLVGEALSHHGGEARYLAFNGYLQFWPGSAVTADWLEALQDTVASVGGHVFGRRYRAQATGAEVEWLKGLFKEWRIT